MLWGKFAWQRATEGWVFLMDCMPNTKRIFQHVLNFVLPKLLKEILVLWRLINELVLRLFMNILIQLILNCGKWWLGILLDLVNGLGSMVNGFEENGYRFMRNNCVDKMNEYLLVILKRSCQESPIIFISRRISEFLSG